MMITIFKSFIDGLKGKPTRKACLRADKKMRDNLDEGQIDEMVDESFPASDPPASY
ncbi:hypothetical protein [Asticcacaulis sp. EMRT-3]|uniref:hypothetical protein n=1 Tax=Asticcacaulis sp. EMRT-3 TaxID=3040349 RepID=UPI0024AF22F4|nr:hypothetical protein [Asticcacaulis sp. EMRT-3]MDI7775343.1 hypothetical protein [Asticcacaulis sp. EMRT-3]